MQRYRSKPTFVDAVQWQPGMSIPGVRPATDDECYNRGWPSGSAVFEHDEKFPAAWQSGSRYLRRITPGDYITRDAEGRVDVKPARYFEDEFELDV